MLEDISELPVDKTLVRKLKDPSSNTLSLFGTRVVSNLDSTSVVINAPMATVNNTNDNGAVYAYAIINEEYVLKQTISIDTGRWYTRYGHDITMDEAGETLVISSPNNDSDNVSGQGRVYIYKKVDDIWVISKELTSLGNTEFGKSIDISGNGLVLAVSLNSKDSGLVNIYICQEDTWVLSQTLTASSDVTKSGFGWVVRLDYSGRTIVVTTNSSISGVAIGGASIYSLVGTKWLLADNLIAPDGITGDSFGYSAEISNNGNDVTIGAPNIPNKEHPGSGAIYVFSNISNKWTPITRINEIEDYTIGSYGCSLALSRSGTAIITRTISNTGNGAQPPNILVYVRGTSSDDTTYAWSKAGNLTGCIHMDHPNAGSNVNILGDHNIAVSATIGGSVSPMVSRSNDKSVVYIMDPRKL